MLMCGKVYFDLTAASSTIIILEHVLIELCDGIVVGSGTDIKHECILRLQVLADTLEEPLMTIDFTVISLFNSENEINSSTFEGLIIESEIPGANLEKMQDVLGYIFDFLVHQLIHSLHLPLSISVLLHETLLFENFDIKELIFRCIFLERFWNPFISITNEHDNKILLTHFDVGIHVHSVIVL